MTRDSDAQMTAAQAGLRGAPCDSRLHFCDELNSSLICFIHELQIPEVDTNTGWCQSSTCEPDAN